MDLDDEAAVLNLKTGVYFGLDEVGAWIWRLIQQPLIAARLSRLQRPLSLEALPTIARLVVDDPADGNLFDEVTAQARITSKQLTAYAFLRRWVGPSQEATGIGFANTRGPSA